MELPISYNKVLIGTYFNDTNKKLKVYFSQQYSKYAHLYKSLLEVERNEAIGSTYVAFMISYIITRIKDPKREPETILYDNFLFAMTYNLVDTILDTPSKDKEENIKAIKIILYNGVKTISNPHIDALYEIYLHFSSREEVIEAMKMAFVEEYRSYILQYSKHDEKDYTDVCEGIGYTMYNLFVVINNLGGIEEYDRIVGYVGQVIDDIADIDEDLRDGIETIATFIYKREGNVDKLYNDAMTKLEKLSDNYEIIRYSLAYLFYYIVSEGKYISESIRNSLREYSFLSEYLCTNRDLGKCIYDLVK